ncbi:MAG TPA: hypothetical protein PLZ27_07720 [Bacillota bacterium]|nr:hypothetical protein [Bacillota bacterium]
MATSEVNKMESLIEQVKNTVNSELERSAEQYGRYNNSDHESYAVILEELDKAKANIELLERHFKEFWESVKSNALDSEKQELLWIIYGDALLAACEFVQVAAMVIKAEHTIVRRSQLSIEEIIGAENDWK